MRKAALYCSFLQDLVRLDWKSLEVDENSLVDDPSSSEFSSTFVDSCYLLLQTF